MTGKTPARTKTKAGDYILSICPPWNFRAAPEIGSLTKDMGRPTRPRTRETGCIAHPAAAIKG